MPDKKFDLGDYVEVKDRIKLFYELYGQGRLVTGDVRVTREPDDTPRVWVQGLAYRTPDDPLPGVGWSWMVLPGTTSYTRGSELENTETSAWGRAIGSLGILIDRSIASANEIEAKSGQSAQPTRDTGGLIGVVEVGTAKDSDFGLRQTPDGYALGFRLKGSDGGIKVIALDGLALALDAGRDRIVGQRVTCWGRISDETFRPKGSQRTVTYQVLALERMTTPDGPLVPVILDSVEAETVPLFSDEEEAELDAALGAKP